MKIQTKKKLAGVLLGFLGYLPAGVAVDNAHFYQAPRFHGMDRFDKKPWDTMLDVSYGYGSTDDGRNGSGDDTSLLNIYGPENLLFLTTGVPKVAAVTDYDTLLAQLLNDSQTNPTTGTATFGQLKFNGTFSIQDVRIDLRQNLASGFFTELHVPVRSVSIEDISYTDLSAATGVLSQQSPSLIRVENNLNVILNAYGIKNYATEYEKTDLGDVTAYLGWQYTDRESFDTFKCISTALRLGILFPTGARDNTSYAFSVPTGYNGHWGIPLRFDFSVGATDWLKFGAEAGAIFFLDRHLNRRLYTNTNQSGFIKLAQGNAKIEKGTLWDLGAHVKFDHFFKGLSAILGYSFNSKEDDDVHATDTTTFSDTIVNSDDAFQQWDSHVIHAQVEYDFSVHMHEKTWAPRLAIFGDIPVAGKRIFNTSIVGGSLGADFMWKF